MIGFKRESKKKEKKEKSEKSEKSEKGEKIPRERKLWWWRIV